MIAVTQVFKALSDPVRVEMVNRLAQGSTFTLGNISSGLGITRQGARKHLDVLERAEVVFLHKKGTSTEVTLNTKSLMIMKKFISTLEAKWDQRLLALKEFSEKIVR
jgi:DNA-binding transcriptional ArsR family regulator